MIRLIALALICVAPLSATAQQAQLLWSTTSSYPISIQIDRVESIDFPLAQQPFISKEWVICSFPQNELLGISNPTGKRRWRWPWNTANKLDLINTAKLRDVVWGTRKQSFAISTDHQQVAYVDARRQSVLAFDIPQEGKVVWGYGRRGEVSASPALGPPCFVKDTGYYLQNSDTKCALIEIDSATGDERRRIDLSDAENPAPDVCYTPVICGQVIVAPLPSGKLIGIRLGDLAVAWTNDSKSLLNAPFRLSANATHVLLSKHGQCRCVDGAGGDLVWVQREVGLFPFAMKGDSVVLGSQSNFSSFRIATGERQWTSELPPNDKLSGNGTIMNGSLLLPVNSDLIHRYQLSTGHQDATFDCSIPVQHLFAHDRFVYSLSATRITKFSLPAVADR